jgi:hypothetical protein
MKPQELAAAVANIEGHKSQARMGDIYESMGIVADIAYKDRAVIDCLISWGIARSKRKRKKKDESK